MGKVSNKMYKATGGMIKASQVVADIEDVAQGKIGKMAKRHIRRGIRKEGNKALNKLFKNIGL